MLTWCCIQSTRQVCNSCKQTEPLLLQQFKPTARPLTTRSASKPLAIRPLLDPIPAIWLGFALHHLLRYIKLRSSEACGSSFLTAVQVAGSTYCSPAHAHKHSHSLSDTYTNTHTHTDTHTHTHASTSITHNALQELVGMMVFPFIHAQKHTSAMQLQTRLGTSTTLRHRKLLRVNSKTSIE